MSRKLLLFCLLTTWGGVAGAQDAGVSNPAADPIHAKRPLDNAKGVLQRNEVAQPQSQGLDNANERVTENQARWIEKHQTAGVERVERVERVDRPDPPERPAMVRPEVARSQAASRPDRPGLGKGR